MSIQQSKVVVEPALPVAHKIDLHPEDNYGIDVEFVEFAQHIDLSDFSINDNAQ